jgi:hypothetical protein
MSMELGTSAIQSGTILIAAATFFGATVGALTQIGLGWWRTKRSKKNLRLALRSEMESQMGLDLDDAGNLTSFDDLRQVFPTPVYESNTDSIGMLSTEEVRKISRFYTALMAHRGMTGQSSQNPDHQEAADELNEVVNELRTEAVDAINEHLESEERSG